MEITLDDIDAAEGAIKGIRVKLQTIGREIYQMREGKVLGSEYAFERYIRGNFAGTNYMNQEGPDWGVPTPIISLVYYWSRAEDSVTVTLPQGWLGQDWRTLERERLAKERAELAEQAAKDAAAKAAARDAEDRAEYARLKARFEEPTHDHNRP